MKIGINGTCAQQAAEKCGQLDTASVAVVQLKKVVGE